MDTNVRGRETRWKVNQVFNGQKRKHLNMAEVEEKIQNGYNDYLPVGTGVEHW